MKNYDKLLLLCSALVCAGGVVAFFLMGGTSSGGKVAKAPKLEGTSVPVWSDELRLPESEAWKAPALDAESGWNYDLFSSPEISWDSDRKEYFAKEPPPAPEEEFGLKLKSLTRPYFRVTVSGYFCPAAPEKEPVPTEMAGRPGCYSAVVMLSVRDETGGARTYPKSINFSSTKALLDDNWNSPTEPSLTLTPEQPITIEGANAKLTSFTIRRKNQSETGTSGRVYEAVIIDEAGETPRRFVVGDKPVFDTNRVEAVFAAGSEEWRYSETRVPGKKEPNCEIFSRTAQDRPFKFLKSGKEIQVGDNRFLIKVLDISNQQVRIEKQSSEIDKKTKAPKITERVLSPES